VIYFFPGRFNSPQDEFLAARSYPFYPQVVFPSWWKLNWSHNIQAIDHSYFTALCQLILNGYFFKMIYGCSWVHLKVLDLVFWEDFL
jgi:hypothetical protein